MANRDLLLYGMHAAFWGCFGLARRVARGRGAPVVHDASEPTTARQEQTAPFSRALVALHMAGFAVMYFGIGNAVLPNRVPEWFFGQRVAGACLITLGAAFTAWALLLFRSWRFRAQVEMGHQLATDGPFRFVRNPIYLGLNLLALGTAIWAPTSALWIAFALVVLGSDLRARAEELVLERAFGGSYDAYRSRTKRFIPGLY